MKIEITDRTMWLTRALAARGRIMNERQHADTKYVKKWRDNWNNLFLSKWFGKRSETDMPDHDFVEGYPSMIGMWDIGHIQSVISALETEGTGRIYISSKELSAIKDWEK